MAPNRRRAWLLALAAPLILGPIWALAVGWTQRPIGTLTDLVVILLLATCTYTDLRYRKIPNWATYSAFLWAVVINGIASATGWVPDPTEVDASSGFSWMGFLFHGSVGLAGCLIGAGLCFFIMIFIYEMAGGGAGDVKLVTALGGLFGVERSLQALIYSYIVAGVIIISWSIWMVGPSFLVKALARKIGSFILPRWVEKPSAEQDKLLKLPVPLSLFFALGAVPVLVGMEQPW
jgi:prepilin peptidase CpaA